jgi:hypothetical protein
MTSTCVRQIATGRVPVLFRHDKLLLSGATHDEFSARKLAWHPASRRRMSPRRDDLRLHLRWLSVADEHSSCLWGGPSKVKIIMMIGAVLVLWSSSATAQGRLAVGPCGADLRKLCAGIEPGNNRLRACMREHIRDVSDQCLVQLAKFAEVRGLRQDCSAHIRQRCRGVPRAGGRFEACLRSAVVSLSDTCKDALARAVRRARS